ncbi:hypothetical protein R1sor_017788 [Riccia sorocarpa]|uniref:Uncharacterized protein n=1 Tax=Riccia sorocarpa TaxID=122646 RepID=A0ABD3I901_9MARC
MTPRKNSEESGSADVPGVQRKSPHPQGEPKSVREHKEQHQKSSREARWGEGKRRTPASPSNKTSTPLTKLEILEWSEVPDDSDNEQHQNLPKHYEPELAEETNDPDLKLDTETVANEEGIGQITIDVSKNERERGNCQMTGSRAQADVWPS